MKKTRLKRMLALLLAAAMTCIMTSTCLAEEIPDELYRGSSYETEINDADDEISALSPDSISLYGKLADMRETFYEYWDTMSANLTENNYIKLEGDKYSFLIKYPKAIVYYGKKISSHRFKWYDFKLYYKDKMFGTISQSDIDKIKLSEVSYNVGLYKYYINDEDIEVKIKGSKGATVDITGKGTVPLKKCTYIKGFKIETEYKELKKDLKKAIKNSGYLDKIKRGKNVYVSANGCKEGGTYGSEEDMYPFVIGVYPAYVNSPSGRFILDVCYSLFTSISANKHTVGEIVGENYEGEDADDTLYIENKYGRYHTKDKDFIKGGVMYFYRKGAYEVPDFINKLDAFWASRNGLKFKNGKIKSVRASSMPSNEDIKEFITLKPDKSNKPKGLKDGGESVIIGDRSYLVTEADGNFFGPIYVGIN